VREPAGLKNLTPRREPSLDQSGCKTPVALQSNRPDPFLGEANKEYYEALEICGDWFGVVGCVH